MVGDLATAEDVVQDAFERLHRGWHGLRQPSNGLAYVRSSVLNGCRSVHRRAAVARKHVPELAEPPDAERPGRGVGRRRPRRDGGRAAVAAPPPARGARARATTWTWTWPRSPTRCGSPERGPRHHTPAGWPRWPGRWGRAEAMTDLEQRLRRDLQRRFRTGRPGLDPAAAGSPVRRRTRAVRWLAPVAAMAAVIGVVAGVSLASRSQGHRSASVPSLGCLSRSARCRRYYVTLAARPTAADTARHHGGRARLGHRRAS